VTPVGRRSARPLPPWSLWAVLGTFLVFATGLTLLALLSGYDLRHWAAVTAQSRATYTVDDHGLGDASAWFMTVGLVLVPVLTVVALILLTAAMLRGNRTAWAVTCA